MNMGSSCKHTQGDCKGIPTIAEVEATGMREALHWLWNNYRKIADIEKESDCLQVVQDCKPSIQLMHTNMIAF
jgi:hypothetical protein